MRPRDPVLSRLPVVVWRRILRFADKMYNVASLPNAPSVPVALFRTLRLADGGMWDPILRSLEEEHRHTVLEFDFREATAATTDSDRLAARLDERSGTLRSLRLGLAMDEYQRDLAFLAARGWIEAFDCISIDWAALFARCTSLERLDLSGLPLRSAHLPRILAAASSTCPRMKALVLPNKEWCRGPVGIEALPLFDALYQALESWWRCGTCNGLRQLTLPQRITTTDNALAVSLADDLLLALAAFCPHLEYLDGWKETYMETHDMIVCEEFISGSLPAWETFCQSCTQLREVNWHIFPCVDAYLEAFGRHPHPQLRQLTIADNGRWDHHEGRQSAASESRRCTSRGLASLLRGCTALDELCVVTQQELNRDHPSSAWRAITDEFLQAVPGSCPKLRRLDIRDVDDNAPGLVEITDAGLTALEAGLGNLQELNVMVTTSITARGVLDFLATLRVVAPRRLRRLRFDVASGSNIFVAANKAPADAASPLLKLTLDTLGQLLDRAHCLPRDFILRFTCPGTSTFDGSSQWRRTLIQSLNELRGRAPSVRVSIRRRGLRVDEVVMTDIAGVGEHEDFIAVHSNASGGNASQSSGLWGNLWRVVEESAISVATMGLVLVGTSLICTKSLNC